MTRGRRTDGSAATRPYAAVSFSPETEAWRFPVGGDLTYTISPEWVEIAPSRLATPGTLVEFQGQTAFGAESRIPFEVAEGRSTVSCSARSPVLG
jgi:hypothetical protein